MDYLFGTTTVQAVKVPIDITIDKIKRLECVDGYYRITTNRGQYLGDVKNNKLDGTCLHTWKSGGFEDGIYKNGKFVSGSVKHDGITYTGINKDAFGYLESLDGKIDYGNGITWKGVISDNSPVKGKGTYFVQPNTSIEFTEWRNIKSGFMGVLTHDENSWIQSYPHGPVKEIKSTDFNVLKMKSAGPKRITFRDGSIYISKKCESEYIQDGDDSFIESSNIATEFKNWSNYQLDYWLVSNRNFDHFPEYFFLYCRQYNVTGQQLLSFKPGCLRELGLYFINGSQLTTELSRFKKI